MFLYCSQHHRRSHALRALLILYALVATPFLLRASVDWVRGVMGDDGSVLVVSADAGMDAVAVTLAGRELRPKPDFSRHGASGTLVFPDLTSRGSEPLLRVTWRIKGVERSAQARVDRGDAPSCIIHLRINAQGEAVVPHSVVGELYAPFSMDCRFAW